MPIRQLGSFNVNVRLHPEVQAQIEVLVYPTGSTADAWLQSLQEDDKPAEDEDEPEEAAEESGDSEEDSPNDA